MLQKNPKQFWNIVRGNKHNNLSLITQGNVIPDHQCACLLNRTFAETFSEPSSSNDILPAKPFNFPSMDIIVISSEGIRSIINKLKISSSCGCDGITTKFLKNTAEYSSLILERIFTQSLLTAVLPNDWLINRVVPLHKSGTTHDPGNFRPISLTSVPCKILEHVIYSHLIKFLQDNDFFTPAQHGFRKQYSCETQLLLFTNDLHISLDSGTITDCIFLDFSKAFDKVTHSLLLHKLSLLNIDSYVLAWIRSFLTNRSQYVSANNFDSSTTPVRSGVPQGSVLGPLLFLIYINDLPNNISSTMRLFADDCVIYRQISNNNDITTLQTDLTNVLNWCKLWQMELNVSKCKSMRISRNTTACPNYFLNSTVLDPVPSYKYLGVHITNNLSWKHHINSVTCKANRVLGFMRRNFYMAPVDLKKLLYITYVRPHLEYASSIWDPGNITLVNELESIQNRAVRFILSDYRRTASVTNMKSIINIPLLATRRKISRLVLFHKIYNNSLLRSLLITPPSYISTRTDHAQKVAVPRFKTSTYSHSFLPKTCKDWNHLPQSVASITSPCSFKTSLDNILGVGNVNV